MVVAVVVDRSVCLVVVVVEQTICILSAHIHGRGGPSQKEAAHVTLGIPFMHTVYISKSELLVHYNSGML